MNKTTINIWDDFLHPMYETEKAFHDEIKKMERLKFENLSKKEKKRLLAEEIESERFPDFCSPTNNPKYPT